MLRTNKIIILKQLINYTTIFSEVIMNYKFSLYFLSFILLFAGCTSSNTSYDDGTNKLSKSPSNIYYDDGTNRTPATVKVSEKKEKVKQVNKPTVKIAAAPKENVTAKKTPDKPIPKKVVVIKKTAPSKPKPAVEQNQSEQKSEKITPSVTPAAEPKQETAVVKNTKFYYPIDKIDVSKDYSESENDKNSGIDFNVSGKTPIKSASPGWVIFAGQKSGVDGYLVIVFHNDKYLTIYSRLDSVAVKKGDYVKGIDSTLGYSSSSFHFEMRQQTDSGIKTLNPKNYLVKR